MQFKDQALKKALTFSFDDGVTQDIRMIELLNKYGLKGTFNLNSEWLGEKGIVGYPEQKLSHYKIHPDDIRFIYGEHEVASHTLNHPFLPNLPDEEVTRQVEEDRLKLSELAGYEVIGMAYPCGGQNNDDRVADVIKRTTGVKYARTISCTDSFDEQTNLYRFDPNVYYIEFDRLMDMGKRFIDLKADKMQIFYVWGHSYEMDMDSRNWVRLEEFFEMISGKDDIFYGTNKEVLL